MQFFQFVMFELPNVNKEVMMWLVGLVSLFGISFSPFNCNKKDAFLNYTLFLDFKE